MKHRVKVNSISPCGCGFEGVVKVSLQEYGKEIECCYIGQNDEVIANMLPIGSLREVLIIRSFAKVSATQERTKAIEPMFIGTLKESVEIDGEDLLVVHAGFPVVVDDELGCEEGLVPGDWVKCSGEFRLFI